MKILEWRLHEQDVFFVFCSFQILIYVILWFNEIGEVLVS